MDRLEKQSQAQYKSKDSGKTRKVRMSELRPTATPRPTTFLAREELNYGDFVFYEGEEVCERSH